LDLLSFDAALRRPGRGRRQDKEYGGSLAVTKKNNLPGYIRDVELPGAGVVHTSPKPLWASSSGVL
jgi:hypothetical protein